MNSFYSVLQLICCLHCFQCSAVHSKHNRNHKNFNNINENTNNFDTNHYLSDENHSSDRNQRTGEHDLWNSYQSYSPDIEDTVHEDRNSEISTERPPYYLSYDSGIKTQFQAMEDKLIEQQMAEESHADEQVHKLREWTPNFIPTYITNEIPSKKSSEISNTRNKDIGSQVKEQQKEQEVDKYSQTDGRRKVGAKGLGGVFGFMVGQHFYKCDKPARLANDPDTGEYYIPESLDYYRRCRYYDVDPRRKNQRRVGRLGRNGYYGYFQNGRFVECAPPSRLDEDEQDPDVYYIPNDIYYEPKCQYYGYNFSNRFDVDYVNPNSFAENSKTFGIGSTLLLPFYLFLSYFLTFI